MGETTQRSKQGSDVVTGVVTERGRATSIENTNERPALVPTVVDDRATSRRVQLSFDRLASGDDERERRLLAAIRQLSPRQREVAERYLRLQPFDEIQRDMKIRSRRAFLSLFRQTVGSLHAALSD